MTMMIDPPPTRPVSERITEPLRIIARRAQMLAWFHATFQLVVLIAAVWLAEVLLLGSRFSIPIWASIPLSVVGWVAVAYGAYRIIRKLWQRRSDITAAALMADAAMPDSQERISSALELSQEPNPAFRGSPELVAVLTRQAEHHADTMDPGNVIAGGQVMRWLGGMCAMLALWALLLLIFTPNMLLGLQRMVSPWNTQAALPAPVVEVIPGDDIKAQGANMQITATIKPPEGLSLDDGKAPISSATIVQHFKSPGGGNAPDILTPMTATGDREFTSTLENLQQSFTYEVVIDGGKTIGKGQSPTYSVTVNSRPGVSDLEVTYSYPKYTRLPPRTDHARDGNLEALVRTQVRLLIHATEPLKSGQLLVGEEGATKTIDLTEIAWAADATRPANSRETLYGADLTIDRSTQYRIKLLNPDGRDNADNQPHTIRARLDELPSISIVQPAAKDNPLHVRPDDVVPMRYVARDDFGVMLVEAIIQVDGQPKQTLKISSGRNEALVTEDWELRVADAIKAAAFPVGVSAKQITYQFRVTDNREPAAQTSLSETQSLVLDSAAAPLAQRLDQNAAREMGSALAQAIQKLHQAQDNLNEIKKNDQKDTLSPDDRARVTQAQQDLMAARQLLKQAADQAENTRLNSQAQELRNVADKPVKAAEEDTVKAGLASDQPQARRASEDSALAHAQEALDQLRNAANRLQTTQNNQPLAQSLENLAKQQQALADALARNPNDPKLIEQQKALQSELDKLIKDNPQLQKPAANASQGRVDDLIRKLDQIEQTQSKIDRQLDAIRGGDTKDAAAQLAKQQEELNRDIQQFNQQQSDTLRQAGIKPQDQAKLDAIPKELQNNQLANAARDEKAAQAALEQAKAKLDAAQKSNPVNDAVKKSLEQANQDAAKAAELQKAASDASQQVNQAANNGQLPSSNPASREAVKQADAVKQAAQQMVQHLPQNSPARNAALEAIKDADAARAAAGRGDSQQLQQQLTNAAQQLSQAAQSQQNTLTNGTMQGPSPDAAAKAAQQAGELATRQQKLAEQTSELVKAQQDAATAKANSEALAEQQRQLADQINSAAKDAQALQQQTQGSAPDLSSKAAQAQQALQQAADAQRAASQSMKSGNAADAASKQDQASDKVASAEQALGGQGRPQTPANNSPSTPNTAAANKPPQGGTPSNPSGQQPSANPGQNASAAAPGQNAQPPGTPNPGQSPSPNANSQGTAQNGQPGASQSGTPNDAAQSVQAARDSQSQALAGKPGAAQQAADQLAQASRECLDPSGQNPSAVQAGSRPNGMASASGSPSAQAGANPSQSGSSGQQGSGGPGSTPSGQPGQNQPGAGPPPGSGQQASAQPSAGNQPGSTSGQSPSPGNGQTPNPGIASQPNSGNQPGANGQTPNGQTPNGQTPIGQSPNGQSPNPGVAGQPPGNGQQPNTNGQQPNPNGQPVAGQPGQGSPMGLGQPGQGQNPGGQLTNAAQPGANNPPQNGSQPGTSGQPTAGGQPGPTGQPGDNGSGRPGTPTAGQPGQSPGPGTPGTPGAQPGQGQPMAGQPGQGQPTPGQPGQGQPVAGQPGQSPGQGTPGAQPSQGQPIAGQPGQGQPAAGQPGQGGSPNAGQPLAGQPGQGTPPGGQGAPPNPAGQPGQGMASGAQPGQGSSNSPGGNGQANGPAGGQSNGPPGQGTANNNPASPSNGTGGSGSGIKVTMNGHEYVVPKEVQDVGVAPSDWVKLSPELQDQLLHAAQQPGPPGYRDRIKDYYSRIARMQSQGGSQ